MIVHEVSLLDFQVAVSVVYAGGHHSVWGVVYIGGRHSVVIYAGGRHTVWGVVAWGGGPCILDVRSGQTALHWPWAS